MEAFLQNLGQQSTTLLSLLALKKINTGDRMLDTSLQVVFTTIVGAIVSALLAIYSQGLFGEFKNYILSFRGNYNPLVFNPAVATAKPVNGSVFLYKVGMPKQDRFKFLSWFYTYHRDKKYTQQLKLSMKYPGLCDVKSDTQKSLLNMDMLIQNYCDEFEIPDNVYLPIWKSIKGDYVYMTTHSYRLDSSVKTGFQEIVVLYSDSADTLQLCIDHIFNHYKTIDAWEKLNKPNEEETRMRMYTVSEVGDVSGKYSLHLSKNKTFDTLFFTQKENILRTLTRFKESTLFPPHLPIDNKLGILLHGPPGTGKTGFITALANFLQREVVVVDTSILKTRTALDTLFAYNNKKYIFVFEEFDTMPGVQSRNLDTVTKGNTTALETETMTPAAYAMMLMAEKEVSSTLAEEYKKGRAVSKDKLDIGYLLSKLDGLESAQDRIIVATTNYPERIDSALLRPGRFGIQINLTNCTTTMVVDLIAMIYQITDTTEKDELRKKVEDIPDYVWSPAEIIQLGITVEGLNEMIQELRKRMVSV